MTAGGTPSRDDLRQDLAAEQADLVAAVSGLSAEQWDHPSAAAGWTVRDQIAHLAYYDGAAALAISDPDGFQVELNRAQGAAGDAGAYEESTLRRSLDGPAALARWQSESAGLHRVLGAADPAVRVPWYGPPMSLTSMVTARIMETWAHGQDVVDALGLEREPTERLRHIAHLGVRTLAFSYAVRGLDPPAEEVAVALTGPHGETWTWGPAGAANRVTGPALDFCLVVTQRRHLDDTNLSLSGPVAEEWMGMAQAFAGPPGPGRPRAG
jgi:uncharacterized protein (TIGR03084 family)